MGTVPVPRTWAQRDILDWQITALELHSIVSFIMNPPMVTAQRTTAQTITNAAWTLITFETTTIDVASEPMWLSTDPTKVTPHTPGVYKGTFNVTGSATGAATGRLMGQVTKNGLATEEVARRDQRRGNIAKVVMGGIPFVVSMNGTTDYLQLYIWHDQTTPISITTDAGIANTRPELHLRWWKKLP